MTSPSLPSSSSAGGSVAPGRSGIWYGLGAYGLWGVLPGFFLLLAPAGPFEIVAFRIIWSLVFCALLLTVTRSWRPLLAAMRTPRVLFMFGLAGVLIYINWQVFVLATVTGHILESSLGYFINPLVTILLGVVFLREHLRITQWVAVGLSFVAVIVLTINYGQLPWMSLVLAFSFGFYSFVKNRMGRNVDAVTGLTLETLWLTPVAIVILILVAVVGPGVSFGTSGVPHALWLASSGIVTAVPLLLFAAAARRVSLVTLGLTQYVAPVLQFLFAVLVMHEPMPAARWLGFVMVWIALVIITVDMVRNRAQSV